MRLLLYFWWIIFCKVFLYTIIVISVLNSISELTGSSTNELIRGLLWALMAFTAVKLLPATNASPVKQKELQDEIDRLENELDDKDENG